MKNQNNVFVYSPSSFDPRFRLLVSSHTISQSLKIWAILLFTGLLLFYTSTALATRKISGVIRDEAGNSLSGVLVKAFDQDVCDDVINPFFWDRRHEIKHDNNGAENDLMGSDYTDSSGNYEITYTGANIPGDGSGHWDPCVHHGDIRWRPDIYIMVELTVRGKPTRIGRSEVTMNQRTRYDLIINIPDSSPGNHKENIDENVTTFKKSGFDPKLHGFSFPNIPRHVCVFPTCKEENIGFLSEVVSFNWALCGGMSLTAMKRYLDLNCNNYSVQLTSNEKLPAELKQEIVQNQIDTLTYTRQVGGGVNLPYATWFLDWQAAPNYPTKCGGILHCIGFRTKGEWRNFIKPELDKKLPVVIGLIYVSSDVYDFDSVTKNHQVLAVGYEENKYFNEIKIFAYDPNYPGGLTEIIFNDGAPRSQLNIEHIVPFELDSSGQPIRPPLPLRGFFMNSRTGLSSWPYGNKNCKADVKMDSVSIKLSYSFFYRRFSRATVTAEVDLSSVVIDRSFPVDKPVSDIIPILVIECNLCGGPEGIDKKYRKWLSNAFFDLSNKRHKQKETLQFRLGSLYYGQYSLTCYADPEYSPAQKLLDPNLSNNSKTINFEVVPLRLGPIVPSPRLFHR